MVKNQKTRKHDYSRAKLRILGSKTLKKWFFCVFLDFLKKIKKSKKKLKNPRKIDLLGNERGKKVKKCEKKHKKT